jgi:hypothetical protein
VELCEEVKFSYNKMKRIAGECVYFSGLCAARESVNGPIPNYSNRVPSVCVFINNGALVCVFLAASII